jgi:replicative DNA helicase
MAKQGSGKTPRQGFGDITLEKSLPNNIEAERMILGAILLDNPTINQALERLKQDDLFLNSHRRIYEKMIGLYEQGRAIDPVTLLEELRRAGELELVGGPAYIAALLDGVPRFSNIDNYTQIVKGKATLRKLITASNQIMAMAFDDEDEPEEVLDQAERLILSIGEDRIKQGFIHIGEVAGKQLELIEEIAGREQLITGIATGFHDLDYMTSGLQRGDLIIIAARPSMGKTALCLGVAQNAALRPQHHGEKAVVGIFSLEMSKEQLVQRLLCSQARVDAHRLRTGMLNKDDWRRLAMAVGELSEARIFLDDTPGVSVLEMRAKARRLRNEQKALDLLIVDYLQLMSGRGRFESRQQEVSHISRELKMLAKELNVPLIALSQLSRAPETRTGSHRPQLSDLRESGCLSGETQIYLPDHGIYRPVQHLVGECGFRVLALNIDTWQLEPCEVSRAFATGRKMVFRLTTRLGRTVRATANHKFLTLSGWRRLDELTLGMRVALPRHLPGPVSSIMSEAELGLLGHMIGDGCTLPRHIIQYTTNDLTLAETVAVLATQVFGDLISPRVRRERKWYQVYLPASFRLTHGRRNPIAAWLDEMGIFGLRSYEKRVPETVFQQSNQGIAHFLRHLWSTDGSINFSEGKKHYANIYYASSSQELARNIQSLLLRLGINASLSRYTQTGKGRDQYHVRVSGKHDIEKFLSQIGALGKSKRLHSATITNYIAQRQANTNRDVLPREVWTLLALPAMREAGITGRQMQTGLGNAYCGTSLYKQNLSRERATKLAEVVGSNDMAKLARSDVYWDKIVSIVPDGEADVYDLTIPVTHNFVANDIIVHNSLEQDADVVMFIYREEIYRPETEKQNIAEIIIGKQRNGPVGSVELVFLKQITRFEDKYREG